MWDFNPGLTEKLSAMELDVKETALDAVQGFDFTAVITPYCHLTWMNTDWGKRARKEQKVKSSGKRTW